MTRKACCPKEGINRGAWTSDEDKLLMDYIALHGLGKWGSIPKKAGLKRCGKSCRLRWLNYLRPDIKRGNITEDEEELIVRLHKLLGNRWSLIAGRIPGRTDNEIKNYWNTCLKKKLMGMSPKQRGRSRARNMLVDKPCSEESTDTIGTNMIHSTVLVPYDIVLGENSEDDLSGCPLFSDILEQFRVREATPMLDLAMDKFVWPDIIGDSLSLEESSVTSYVSSGYEHGGFGNVDANYLGFYNIGGQIMNPFVEDGIWDTLMLQKI